MRVGRGTRVSARGETMTIREWSERTGLCMDTLIYRAGRGLTGDAFLAPGRQRDGAGVTRKQREALDTVRKLTEELGRPPTFVQVGNRLGLSAHGAAKRLKPLRGRFVRWEPYEFGTLTCI
jgi:hypothetical protein